MPGATSSTSRPATRTSRRSPGSGSATSRSCTGSTPSVRRTRTTRSPNGGRFVEAFFAAAKKARDALPESARGPLDSRHRDGVFVNNVAVDNNAAERGLRGIAVELSFGSVDGARLMLIFGTLEGISPYPWLSLAACARHGGPPPESPAAWLPWGTDGERLRSWKTALPQGP